jgi:hypothetical protein
MLCALLESHLSILHTGQMKDGFFKIHDFNWLKNQFIFWVICRFNLLLAVYPNFDHPSSIKESAFHVFKIL